MKEAGGRPHKFPHGLLQPLGPGALGSSARLKHNRLPPPRLSPGRGFCMVGGRQPLQVWGRVSREGLRFKEITLAAGEEEIRGTSAGWRTGGRLGNSGTVRGQGGGLDQGSNSGNGENWKDPWSRPGGSMGPWCTGGGWACGRPHHPWGQQGGQASRPFRGVHGREAGAPIQLCQPPIPHRPAVTRTRSGHVSSSSSQHGAPEGLSPSWSHQSRPESLPGIVEPI